MIMEWIEWAQITYDWKQLMQKIWIEEKIEINCVEFSFLWIGNLDPIHMKTIREMIFWQQINIYLYEYQSKAEPPPPFYYEI